MAVATDRNTGSPHFGHGGARIVADFGGTHARFATLGEAFGALGRVEVLLCADFPTVEAAFSAYMATAGIQSVEKVCLAVAAPVGPDRVELPNGHWSFQASALEAFLGGPVTVINDFTAQALGIELLGEDEIDWFGSPRPEEGGIRAVIGPGTGLGVAIQMPDGSVIPSEAGHVGFAPNDEHQLDLLRALMNKLPRVSTERFASGPGLQNLYWANRGLETNVWDTEPGAVTAPRIAELAAQGDATAVRSVEDFLSILGSFAGDMALAAWTTGGIYLSGGVLSRLTSFLDPERFRETFEDKGRFSGFCRSVPLGRITAEHPGLLGCCMALECQES